jgi:hypothetical protein
VLIWPMLNLYMQFAPLLLIENYQENSQIASVEIFSRIKELSVSELSVEISKNIDAPTFVIFLLLYFYKFEHFLHSYLVTCNRLYTDWGLFVKDR